VEELAFADEEGAVVLGRGEDAVLAVEEADPVDGEILTLGADAGAVVLGGACPAEGEVADGDVGALGNDPASKTAKRRLRRWACASLDPAVRDSGEENGRAGETALDRTEKHHHGWRDGNPELYF